MNNQEFHNFSANDVQAIRNQRAAKVPLKVLAKQYNCSIALISKIARGIIYKEVK